MNARTGEFHEAVRQILLKDWNPIGCDDVPSNEYDSYIVPVCQILLGSRSEEELVRLLFVTARDVIGVAEDTVEHSELGRQAARNLLRLEFSLLEQPRTRDEGLF
jgi:hypothetical protein